MATISKRKLKDGAKLNVGGVKAVWRDGVMIFEDDEFSCFFGEIGSTVMIQVLVDRDDLEDKQ